MPRLTLFFAFILSFQAVVGEGLKIITSGGLQGVADSKGQILVPAIYEKLGWSDGHPEIVEESVGYYANGKWGLLNVKNQKVTEALYATLKPFGRAFFEAGIRKVHTNRVQRGLIDAKGKVILDFNYFTIDQPDPHHFIVSEYQDGLLRYGVMSDKNELLIACEHSSMQKLDDFFLAGNAARKVRIFNPGGSPVLNVWVDKVERYGAHYLVHNEGYVGLMDTGGHLMQDLAYKAFVSGEPQAFPQWEVRKIGSSGGEFISCDSIYYNQHDDLLIAHVNRSEHLLAASSVLFKDQQHRLKHIKNGFLVTQNNALQSWGIYKTDGREVAAGFDSVAVDSMYYYGKTLQGWDIYNLFGRKINDISFQEVFFSQERNIPVKRNGYWGWIDFQGQRIVDYRYDRIVPTVHQGQFLANNYGKWGVSTFADKWLIRSEYDSMYAFQNFYVGTKGSASYVFNTEGQLIRAIPYALETSDYLKITDGELIGAITRSGYFIEPRYRSIQLHSGDYYELVGPGGQVTMIAVDGRSVIKEEDRLQDVLTFSEGYFHIIKDGKHGFVDTNGKLRVANRYDSAQYYNEGLAPVKLMGRWGFIDAYEILRIQPFYRHSSVFKGDLAIVQAGDQYGIIDKKGNEIVEVRWKHIRRLETGNYLVTDWDDKAGLVDGDGHFLIRPNYDALEDTDRQLLVATRYGKKGVLDYQGLTKVPFEYQQIEIQGDYLLLLKE